MAASVRPSSLIATSSRQLAKLASARPTLDDVERLARGDATKRRGIGSRNVPHRLNASERTAYAIALRTGFALLDGSGHRRHKDAKGIPLLNVLRQRADSLARPLIWIERLRSGDLWHTCVDYSPVRSREVPTLQALHRRALHVVHAEAIDVAHIEAPWQLSILEPDRSGPHGQRALVAVADESVTSSPIWALPACAARFSFRKDDEMQRKECKRLAKALVHEF